MKRTQTRGVELGTDLRNLQERYIKCRLKKHSWDEIPDDGKLGVSYNTSGAERHLFRCTNCTTRALEIWVRATGDLLKRVYDYPKGYRLSKDANGDRILIDQIRLEVMRRNRNKNRRAA